MYPSKTNKLFYLWVLLENEKNNENLKILVCGDEVSSSFNSKVNIVYKEVLKNYE